MGKGSSLQLTEVGFSYPRCLLAHARPVPDLMQASKARVLDSSEKEIEAMRVEYPLHKDKRHQATERRMEKPFAIDN
jgi:hypothetical protein